MFGKHFEQLYERSMVGAGAIVFAVWGYVIAKQKPDRNAGSVVMLNPDLIAAILGESPKDVDKAIDFLCSPDAKSTSPEHKGRRLLKMGQFEYKVVNGAKYRAIRNEEDRTRQNREAQRRFREKQLLKPVRKLPGESEYENAEENGYTQEEKDRIVESRLPDEHP